MLNEPIDQFRKWKQTSTQCDCGSWYAILYNESWLCNNVDCRRERDISEEVLRFSVKRHIIKGKTWSKKLHRYVTNKDIKAGRV
jgi:hypothetical protein